MSILFPSHDQEGRIRYKLLDVEEVEEIARVSGDSYLAELAGKAELTTAESIYVTNRMVDRLVLDASDSAFKAKGARVLEEAVEPLERRGAIGLTALKQAYRSYTPVNIKKVVAKVTDPLLKKPSNVQAQTAQTRASTQIFNTQINEGVQRLERSMKGAFGNVAREYDQLQNEFNLLRGSPDTEMLGSRRVGMFLERSPLGIVTGKHSTRS